MENFLIMTIQVTSHIESQNFNNDKIFAINLLLQPLICHHLGFHIFLHNGRGGSGAHPFFTAGLFCNNLLFAYSKGVQKI